MKTAAVSRSLCQLSAWIAERLGLHFPEERWGELERDISMAAQELGFPDPESYISRLVSEPAGRTTIETLAGYLTVGETYFFREPRSFEALETQVLPELIKTRRNQAKRLRIWSAGCCSGEEPYSIAILLDKLIADYPQWNSSILATDITPRFLQKAVDGIYGEWSFRGMPDRVRERYFTQLDGGRYQLTSRIKERVAFSYLNLADDNYPSLLNDTNAMDVIFCRNVLMYFSDERAKKVMRNLHRALTDDGWLILSVTECPNESLSLFTPVEFPGAVLYRKRKATDKGVEVIGPEVLPFEEEPEIPSLDSPDGLSEPALTLRSGEALLQVDHLACSRNARKCANQGKLTEAAGWCERAIDLAKFNPGYRYLLAMIQQEQGLNEAAIRSLLHALYLDPDFVLAHFALGNMHRLHGQVREAEKYFNNVRMLLQTLPEEQSFPESEGLTAGRLGEIVGRLQACLAGQNPMT
ncbi:MAG: CheR family methyltransferase [Gammaproteobacteria bacterium]